MRVSTPFMAVVGGAAGAVFAVVGYQSSHTPVADQPTSYRTRPVSSAVITSPPRITTLWLPCVHGTHLRHGTCVRVVHRVVTVVDPAPPATAPAGGQPATAPATGTPAQPRSPGPRPTPVPGSDDGPGDD